MGVRQLLSEVRNRVEGNSFEVWEEADGSVQAYQNENPMAAYQTDSNGNVVGLLGPGGEEIVLGPVKNSVMLFGDSITEQSWKPVNITSSGITNNGDGTATAVLAGAPNSSTNQLAVGDVIKVNNSATPIFNQQRATITAVSNTPTYSFTYTITGGYSTMVGGEPAQFSVMARRSIVGWWGNFVALSGAEFEIVAPCYQGGSRIRHGKEILESGYSTTRARFGIIGPYGVNDVYVDSRTLDQMKTDAADLIDAAAPRVQYLAVMTIPAMYHSKSGYSAAKMQQIQKYNRWLLQYVKSKGCIPIDSNLAKSNNVTYAGADTTYADASSGFYNTSDYTHPTGVGAYALGKAAYAALSAYIVPTIIRPATALDAVYHSTDSEFMLDSSHVLLTGTGGTRTAGSGTITNAIVPDDCTVAWVVGGSGLTATLTSVARTVATDGDAIGNNFSIAFSGTSAGSSLCRFSITATLARFALADVIRGLCDVTITSPSGIAGVTTTVRVAQASMSQSDTTTFEDVDLTMTETVVRKDVTEWREINANSGALSAVRLYVDVWTAASGAISGTVTIAHPNIQKQLVP